LAFVGSSLNRTRRREQSGIRDPGHCGRKRGTTATRDTSWIPMI
jgi:hypothetical protein